MLSRRATTSTLGGREPDLLVRLAQCRRPQIGVDTRLELAARERDLAAVRRHRLRALDEHDPRFAVGFVERDEHGRGLAAFDIGAPFDGGGHVGQSFADLGEREAAARGGEAGPTAADRRAGRMPGAECAAAHPRLLTTMTIVPTPCETPAPMDWNLATAFESVCDAIPDRIALIQGDSPRPVAHVRRPRRPYRGGVHRGRAGARLQGRVVPLQLQRVHRGAVRARSRCAAFPST